MTKDQTPLPCPTEDQIEGALNVVQLYRDRKYPVGEDRAFLCHAAIILADAWNKRADQPGGESWTMGEIVSAILYADIPDTKWAMAWAKLVEIKAAKAGSAK